MKRWGYWIIIFILIAYIALLHYRQYQLHTFLYTYEQIKQRYVTVLPPNELQKNAIRGMLQGLGSHSRYLNSDDLKLLQEKTSGEFTGVGLKIMGDDDELKVITPIEGGSAKKAGILPGDEITYIDGQSVKSMGPAKAIKALRGKPNTWVTLIITRENQPAPLTFKLERLSLKTQNVTVKMLAPDIAYARIDTFQINTASMLSSALEQLRQNNSEPWNGLILDLRNNPGGVFDAAVGVSNLFLNKDQLILTTKSRDHEMTFYAKANNNALLNKIPLVILVNQGSASSAEIVAGALQDYHRATIIGTSTFGKGSVQTIIPLDKKNNSAVKLTTALYYTPEGRLIDRIGIMPDIVVEKSDAQLTQAINSLRQTQKR